MLLTAGTNKSGSRPASGVRGLSKYQNKVSRGGVLEMGVLRQN